MSCALELYSTDNQRRKKTTQVRQACVWLNLGLKASYVAYSVAGLVSLLAWIGVNNRIVYSVDNPLLLFHLR